jgi:hypothetical protein
MAVVGLDEGGYHVEFYTDSDGGPGYGDDARVSYWYGSRAACEALAKSGAWPKGQVWLRPRHSMTGIERHETHADNY